MLSNRFPEELKYNWHFHYECLVCGKNRWDALHHIISPSSMNYIKGDHNKSILNSCPIHNDKCHLGNGELHNEHKESELLQRTVDALLKLDYKLKQIDLDFLETYKHMYET